MGFCRRKTAMKQSKDSAESLANLRAAAESYARAAEYIPVDDEKHVCTLHTTAHLTQSDAYAVLLSLRVSCLLV